MVRKTIYIGSNPILDSKFLHMKNTDKKKGMHVTQSSKIFDLFQTFNDDPRGFKIGDRVKKTVYEEADKHFKGHRGIIIGKFILEKPMTIDEKECSIMYLVSFHNDDKNQVLREFTNEQIKNMGEDPEKAEIIPITIIADYKLELISS